MTRTIGREIATATVLGILMFGPALLAGQTTQAPPANGGLPDLVGALKATQGVLGVDTAQTQSGKQVIFAWFENKRAALNWYYSDTHRAVQKMFAPGSTAHTPMSDVPDDGRPVLAIASLTPSKERPSAANPFPVTQISIELYTPLPGGIAVGGRFAPRSLNVPGLVDMPLPSKQP
jgi:hypothetical protein